MSCHIIFLCLRCIALFEYIINYIKKRLLNMMLNAHIQTIVKWMSATLTDANMWFLLPHSRSKFTLFRRYIGRQWFVENIYKPRSKNVHGCHYVKRREIKIWRKNQDNKPMTWSEWISLASKLLNSRGKLLTIHYSSVDYDTFMNLQELQS